MKREDQNTEVITTLRLKYEPALWNLLYNHPEGIAAIADVALYDLNEVIKSTPKLSLDEQYMIFVSNVIRKGNNLDTGDLLQSYTATQLKRFIDDCYSDFTLLLFCTLLLSFPNIREMYLRGSSQDLELYLDLIYSKTIYYRGININPMEIQERYNIAESLAGELTIDL